MSDDLLVFRFLETILPSEGTRRIVILTGARQTGKTTSAQRKYPGLRYINLDAPKKPGLTEIFISIHMDKGCWTGFYSSTGQ